MQDGNRRKQRDKMRTDVQKETHARRKQTYGGVVTSARLLKTVGILCRISSLLQSSFAKETFNLYLARKVRKSSLNVGWLRLVGSLKP